MRKGVITPLDVVVIVGSAVQMTAISARYHQQASAAASEQFRNASNSNDRMKTVCNTQELGRL